MSAKSIRIRSASLAKMSLTSIGAANGTPASNGVRGGGSRSRFDKRATGLFNSLSHSDDALNATTTTTEGPGGGSCAINVLQVKPTVLAVSPLPAPVVVV